jgi:hypothetical protein
METVERAGGTRHTRAGAGSYDCGLLQLYPALQAVHESFLPSGPSPSRLQEVPGSLFPGQQSPASVTWVGALISCWQLRCTTPARP